MKKKDFPGNPFNDRGSSDPLDHDVYARIGEGLLASIEAKVSETKTTITAIREEIAEYHAEWERECQEEDWSLGDILMTAFLQKISQLNAEMNLAYKICDSWREKNYGIIS